MPTRKQLQEILKDISHEQYAVCIPLNKTSYSDHESNQIQLQVMIAFYTLPIIDKVLCKLNASPANINIATFKQYLRDAYNSRTKAEPYQKQALMSMYTKTTHLTKIGKNQATKLLLECTKEAYNV